MKTIDELIGAVKAHPKYHEAGMILIHNGVVRGTSRDGRRVSGLTVAVDHERLAKIISENKRKPGIVEILVEIAQGRHLSVGEDVMFLVVAGNIRENVVAVLKDTLDAVKRLVTDKTEFFISE